MTITTTFLGIFKRIKINENAWVIIAWSIFYFVLFSFGEITSRYFVILIPVLYVIAVFGIVEVSKQIFLHANK
jgi:hypothetical protein